MMALDFLDTMNKKQAMFIAFLWALFLLGLFGLVLLVRHNYWVLWFAILIFVLAVGLIFIVCLIFIAAGILIIYDKLGDHKRSA
jgi:hypothetical protein